MIARLRGEIAELGSGRAVVDVNGVGYDVNVGQRTIEALTEGDEATLHISTQIREDDITLYGFTNRDERLAFQILLGVNKVGPQLAMSLLNTLPLGDLSRAVETDDVIALSRVPGVGKKTAQRLALELKGKLPAAAFEVPAGPAAPARPEDPLPLALARLGYRKSEIDQALLGLRAQDLQEAPLPQRLSAALKILSGRT